MHNDDLIVRHATRKDAPALAQLHHARHSTDPTETEIRIRDHLDEIASGLQFAVCVALLDQQLVGYGMVGYRAMDTLGARNLPSGIYLAGVYTLPAYRMRGIGHALTQYRIQWANGQADRVYYYTHQDNQASIALHSSLGFTERSRDFDVPPDIPGSRENMVLFAKAFS